MQNNLICQCLHKHCLKYKSIILMYVGCWWQNITRRNKNKTNALICFLLISQVGKLALQVCVGSFLEQWQVIKPMWFTLSGIFKGSNEAWAMPTFVFFWSWIQIFRQVSLTFLYWNSSQGSKCLTGGDPVKEWNCSTTTTRKKSTFQVKKYGVAFPVALYQ